MVGLMVPFGRHVQPTDVVFDGLFIWVIDFLFVDPSSCTRHKNYLTAF
jgi:hypothetical protein